MKPNLVCKLTALGIAILFGAVSTRPAFSQQRVLSGTVTDLNGKPLAGASISLLPSHLGTVSSKQGYFSLYADQQDREIQVSLLSFKPATLTIGSRTAYKIQLSPLSLDLSEVVSVGTRSAGRTRLNSAAPVDIFLIPRLQRLAPQTDLNQLLQYASPSFNSTRQSSSDGTEHIDPASIRGLGPDQLLVLVNGKRRHTSSLVNNQGTIGNGSVGTDLNALPASAIDRIEVLRDGASAQYGSDAIAGVMNIILKQNTHTLQASTSGGISSRSDGQAVQLNLNYGTDLGKQGGFINLTAEAGYHNRTTRTQNNNLILFDQSSLNNYFSYDSYGNGTSFAASKQFDDAELAKLGQKRDAYNFQIGDARIKNISAFFNLSLPFTDGRGEVYAFGGYNYRQGEGYGFRRLPSDPTVNAYPIYPYGYQPNTTSHIQDRSASVGIKRKLGDWNADLSNTLGDNRFDYLVNHTVNASLGAASPTSFKAGGHEFLQNTTNLDFSRKYNQIAAGLNLALGAEFRVDNYRIRSGQEASWKNYALVDSAGVYSDPSGRQGGSQSFPGFSPANALNKTRTNSSVYADAELDLTHSWLIGGAARFEHYSDFGSTLNGKVSTLYKIVRGINVRGALSTGFRAPSLQQEYFSYISTDILPSGQLGSSGFFNNYSLVARALGIPRLKQETSVNYSAGFTARPAKDLNLSLDGYLITIRNRIVLTGSFGGAGSGDSAQNAGIQQIISPLGANTARFFSNAINTRTLGLDFVADYTLRSGPSIFNMSFGLNVNKTTIGRTLHIPAALKGQEHGFFSPNDSTLITDGNPRTKANLTLTYSYKKLTVLLRDVYFGQVARDDYPYGTIQHFGGKAVTDLSVSYNVLKALTLTGGINNLFDVFPEKQIYANSYLGVFKYPSAQMGVLGRFYMIRLTLNLKN